MRVVFTLGLNELFFFLLHIGKKILWEIFDGEKSVCTKEEAKHETNKIEYQTYKLGKPSIFGDTVPRENLLNFRDFIPGGR